MPNHIANKLVITGDAETLGRLVSTIETPNEDEGRTCHIDFEKIIPMPKELDRTECSSNARESLAFYLYKTDRLGLAQKLCPCVRIEKLQKMDEGSLDEYNKAFNFGEDIYKAYEKTGFMDWYDWRICNWNTKWNAYDTYIEEYEPTRLELYFSTAWCAPLPVIDKLISMFPELEFDYKYADEDFSYNTGRGYSEAGFLTLFLPEGGSDEAVAIYIETHQCDADDFYKDEKGEWHNRMWEDDEDDE